MSVVAYAVVDGVGVGFEVVSTVLTVEEVLTVVLPPYGTGVYVATAVLVTCTNVVVGVTD